MIPCPASKRGEACRGELGHSGFHAYAPPSKRKRLKVVGAKARRELPAWEACKAAVDVRSRGVCEARVHPGVVMQVCGTRFAHAGHDHHHTWPEDRDCGLHDPARVLLLCRAAHRFAHSWPAEAARLGLLRPDRLDASL